MGQRQEAGHGQDSPTGSELGVPLAGPVPGCRWALGVCRGLQSDLRAVKIDVKIGEIHDRKELSFFLGMIMALVMFKNKKRVLTV